MSDCIFNDEFSEIMMLQAVTMKIDRDIEEYESLPDTPVSNKLERRLRKLFDKVKKEEKKKKSFVLFKRLSIALAACFMLFSISMLCVPDIRATVKNTFVGWYDGFTIFESDDSLDLVDVSNYKPNYIPEGFQKTEEYIDENMNTQIYRSDQGEFIYFSCNPISSTQVLIDNENLSYKLVDKIYHTFTANTEDKESSVVWQKDNVTFSVGGTLPTDELLKIAKSVSN
jgi:hypothetical protein